MPRASDLNLADPAPDPTTEERRLAFLDGCEMLLDDDRFQFAWPTVADMRDKVRDGFTPTEKMWQALANITEGGRRQARQQRNWGRRYEGR